MYTLYTVKVALTLDLGLKQIIPLDPFSTYFNGKTINQKIHIWRTPPLLQGKHVSSIKKNCVSIASNIARFHSLTQNMPVNVRKI